MALILLVDTIEVEDKQLQRASLLRHTQPLCFLPHFDATARHGGRVTSLGPKSLPILACRDLYPNSINFIGQHN